MNDYKDLLSSLKTISPDMILNDASQIVIGEEYLKMEVWAGGRLTLYHVTFLEVNGDRRKVQVDGKVAYLYLEGSALVPRKYENGHRIFKKSEEVERLLKQLVEEQATYGYLYAIGLDQKALKRYWNEIISEREWFFQTKMITRQRWLDK